MFFLSVAALFRFVARFARVRVEDSSGNRFALTAYFTKPGFVGGNVPGGNNRDGTFRREFSGGDIPVTVISTTETTSLSESLNS